MENEKRLKAITALGVFTIAFLTYLSTVAPTVSFWDCGELIGASNILGNPHPPGNPLFALLARAFLILMPLQEAAARVNFISVLTSALTVTMVFVFTLKLLGIFFQGKLSRFAALCSSVIAAFLVAFSDTFWFSAVEAEVYGTSMLIVMAISWLSLDWYENRGSNRAKRALILICYLGFLGMGVHPFSFITIPAVAVFLLLSDKGMRTDIPFLLTGVALLSVVYDIGDFVWYSLAMLAICVLMAFLSRSPEWKGKWKLSMWLCIVAILGFSSYAYVPIRSMVSPNIDEGEPKTWSAFKEYVERKQYGSESMLGRALHRRGTLQNQILVHPHMGYGGYMLGQYLPWKAGETRADENEPVLRQLGGKTYKFRTLWTSIGKKPGLQFVLFVLFQLPFLYGGYLAYKRNPQVGAYLLLLYAATSYGLVFYMNFADGSQMELRDYEYWKSTNFSPEQKPDPVHIEVRDRDYFFTPGFIFMGILFGVASAFLLKKLGESRGGPGLSRGAGVALACLALAVPVFSNYREHDRSGDYVPWDYAHNLLQSCRPNSVLFTNGDNDTFPLWFLQQVENIRKDVKVVNLSLVNTNWYIHQLKEHEPKLVIGFNRDEIDAMQPQAWPSKERIRLNVPNSKIVMEMEPRGYLKVQDIMVIHIVQNNYPKRPIHFAVTVSDDNMMGLEKYIIMEGLVYTLTERQGNKEIDPVVTARMVDSVYKFRGLGDPKFYVDLNTEGLLTNYSSTNFRLMMWARDQVAELDRKLDSLRSGGPADSVKALERERAEKIAFAERYLRLNLRILPREWRNYYYGAQFYSSIKDYAKAETLYRQGMKDSVNAKILGANLAEMYVGEKKFAQAESLLTGLVRASPNDIELIFGLNEVYQKTGELRKAMSLLVSWYEANSGHQYAPMVAQQIQFLNAQINSPAPAVNVPDQPPAAAEEAGKNSSRKKTPAVRGKS